MLKFKVKYTAAMTLWLSQDFNVSYGSRSNSQQNSQCKSCVQGVVPEARQAALETQDSVRLCFRSSSLT